MILPENAGKTRGWEDLMHEKKSISERVDEFLGGKGFYIVLFACVAVIGVSAWLLLFSRFSPLDLGDEVDYVDAMGNNVTPKDPDAGSETDTPNPPEGSSQPEHQVPENKDTQSEEPPKGTGALTVQEDPKETTKDTPKDTGSAGEEPETPDDKADTASSLKPEELTYVWPVSGKLTVGYSPGTLIYSNTMADWRVHDGIDIEASQGTNVLSCAAGTVIEVRDDELLGTTVVIDHGAGVVSTYSNLAAKPAVKVGDTVALADVIGSVGATALSETADPPHLHFSLTINGETADPTKYLPKI